MDVQAKLKELGERVMGSGRSENGSETHPSSETGTTVSWAEGTLGKNVDWTNYNIPAEKLVAYRRATFTNGEWICPYTFFHVVSQPTGKLGDQLELLINSEAGWKLTSLQPHGSGIVTAVLTRSVSYGLPLPKPLSVAEVVEDEDTSQIDSWAESNRGSNESASS